MMSQSGMSRKRRSIDIYAEEEKGSLKRISKGGENRLLSSFLSTAATTNFQNFSLSSFNKISSNSYLYCEPKQGIFAPMESENLSSIIYSPVVNSNTTRRNSKRERSSSSPCEKKKRRRPLAQY
uniref:Uncharacterized protein n=1 Tax=Aureoumbra lagunensis TaxID=44058 RepID=A0A7S3JUL1_9STRA|mmetsp:Transcript_19210/g.24929  ORF Transcript_19210/g.24929 Transcript_19210/m.24929 type:complete len:124 (+) Transcript_19210:50-421(+)